ncbi:MAG: hypothetical protein LBN21_06610 [Treponema sp.]|jgi:hypothetical protein|nr:hypothetical protein [Treponema sp.]
MALLKTRKKLFICGLILAVLAGLAGFALSFVVRAPVLMVTDEPFIALYGPKRVRVKRWEVALRLFRRVKPISVAESAGADVIAFALEEAAAKPYCILVPYRYAEGAYRYAEQFPGTPLAILDTRRAGKPAHEGPLYINTDRDTDFYRAGLFAGILAGNSGGGALVFKGQALDSADKSAFMTGFQEMGVEKIPVYPNTIEPGQLADISCAVIVGTATDYFNSNPKKPVILFSWIDPLLTVQDAAVIFDDSPWALAVRAVNIAAGKEAERNISSKILFPRGRIADKHILRQLKWAARRSLPPGK